MLITYTDDELIVKCFSQYVFDHDAIDWNDHDLDAQFRCAATVFSHYVQRLLVDLFCNDIEEEGVI